MVFRLTKKLSEKLHLGKLPRTETPEEGSTWHANLLRASGVQYIVLTESLTLYSLLILGRGIVDGAAFGRIARQIVGAKFEEEGWSHLLGNRVAFDTGEPIFLAAHDRSVIASIGEISRMAKFEIEGHERSLDIHTNWINQIPYSKRGKMGIPVMTVDTLAGYQGRKRPL